MKVEDVKRPAGHGKERPDTSGRPSSASANRVKQAERAERKRRDALTSEEKAELARLRPHNQTLRVALDATW